MTTSQTFNAGDFSELKESLVTFMKAQNKYLDVDFEGSNISSLLNVLAYNTSLDMFYYNMALNESFIDSAVLRSSAISLAKQLNYAPQSFSSAVATVNISVTTSDLSRGSLVIPKGTYFGSKVGSTNMIFTTDVAVTSSSVAVDPVTATATFLFPDVNLYQGVYVSESFAFTGVPIVIENQQIDTSSLSVTVVEDNGKTFIPYKKYTTIVDVTKTTPAFFVEGTASEKYQVVFGNDIHGRKPKTNAVVTVDYRISDGELPNGAGVFFPLQPIDGESNITIETAQKARGGSVYESTESIRFNAPKFFQTRGNAITANDYAILLKNEFPEVVYAVASGGETLVPPQYGKVVVAVACSDVVTLPTSRKLTYKRFLDARNSLSIDCQIIDPKRIKLSVESFVKSSGKTPSEQIVTIVHDAIDQYAQDLVSDASTLRMSRLTAAIDNSNDSITSNDTVVRVLVKPTAQEWIRSSMFEFGVSLSPGLTSSPIIRNGVVGSLKDSDGNILFVTSSSSTFVGSVDYDAGTITLGAWKPDNISLVVTISCLPASRDITPPAGGLLSVEATNVVVV